MINPHKTKYFPLYWSMVEAAAAQSVATRHKVGAVVVTPTGMLSIGWNGTPPGMPNDCENGPPVIDYENGGTRYKTNPEVIHAERNAIDKMTRQGVPTQGSVLFVSRAPCFECAKALHGLGLKAVFYLEEHDDMSGVEMLQKLGIKVEHHFVQTIYQELNTYYQRGPV
jgi:dCMP deaminase